MAKSRLTSRPVLEWLTVCGPAAYLTVLAVGVLYLHPHPLPPFWPAFFLMLALSLAGTFVFSRFVFVHVRRQEAEIVRQTQELAAANEAMAVIRERQHIAHEVHDHLAQTLGYLHLKLADLQRQVAADDPAGLEIELADLKKVTRDAYEEARQAIFGLRSMVSRSLGLIPTLTEYLHDWSRRTAIAADLRVGSDEAIKLPPAVEVQLIGIILEALANVRKHAGARHVLVGVELRDATTRVVIQDDGRGFDPGAVAGGAAGSFGLEMMAERADAVGGKLTISSRPGEGARVEVELPTAEPAGRKP